MGPPNNLLTTTLSCQVTYLLPKALLKVSTSNTCGSTEHLHSQRVYPESCLYNPETIPSWWFQPTHLQKYARQIGDLPPNRGENKQHILNDHLNTYSFGVIYTICRTRWKLQNLQVTGQSSKLIASTFYLHSNGFNLVSSWNLGMSWSLRPPSSLSLLSSSVAVARTRIWTNLKRV